jgi:photosystem II stability/assembly factor-like uncharacterized protein
MRHFKTIIANVAHALLQVALMALLLSSAHATEVNLLDQPAGLSAKAVGVVQLSIARAGNRLVSVGERGVVLVSNDNGKTWRQSKVPVSVSLTRIAFVNDKTGWAIGHGGVVLATTDGGDTWAKQLDGIGAAKLELDAAQADAKVRAGNADAKRRLADAQRLVDDGADKPLLALYFFDAKRGFVVGAYGIAFGTVDGGQTWKSTMGSLAAANGRHLYGIQPLGDSLLLVGEQGLVLKSTDGGANFSKLAFPGKGTLFGALTSKAGDALLVYGLKGNAFRSVDAGTHWDKVGMPPVSLVAGIRLNDGAMLLADESGQLHRSEDAGLHFQSVVLTRPAVLAGLVQANDGTVVGSGMRGNAPLALPTDAVQDNKRDKP